MQHLTKHMLSQKAFVKTTHINYQSRKSITNVTTNRLDKIYNFKKVSPQITTGEFGILRMKFISNENDLHYYKHWHLLFLNL